MSRLADIREQDATGKAADIFAGIKKAMGKVPNAYLTIGGHSPAALQQALAHNAMLHKGSLSAQQLEAINLSVSEATGCDYCPGRAHPDGEKSWLQQRADPRPAPRGVCGRDAA